MADNNETIDETIERFAELARTGKLTDQNLRELAKATKSQTTLSKEAAKSVATMASGATDFVKAVSGGSTSLNTMTTVVSAAGDTITGGLSAINEMVKNIPIASNLIGGAAKLGSVAVQGFTKAINFSIGRIQATYDAFKEVSQQGLIGADGMQGLRSEIDKSKIPMERFAKMLSSNAQDFSYLSGSALAGGKQFAGIMGDMQKGQGLTLRRLGFSIEEIGDTVVNFQKTYRMLGIQVSTDQKKLTESTTAYGRELDMIAKITGQSRKEAQRNREAMLNDTRFRAWQESQNTDMGKKRAFAMADLVGDIKRLAPSFAEGMKDLLASGGVATTEAGKRLIQQGMGPIVNRISRDMMNGNMSLAQGRKALFQAALENKDKFKSLSTLLGDFGVGIPFQEIANMARAAGMSDKQIKELGKSQKDQVTGQDKMTDSITKAVMSMQEMQVNLDIMSTSFPVVSHGMEAFASTMNRVVAWLRTTVLGESATDVAREQAMRDKQMQAAQLQLTTKVTGKGEGATLEFDQGQVQAARIKQDQLNFQMEDMYKQYFNNGKWVSDEQQKTYDALKKQREIEDKKLAFVQQHGQRKNLAAVISHQNRGFANNKVRAFLKQAGWSDNDIDNAPIDKVLQVQGILARHPEELKIQTRRGGGVVAPKSVQKELATANVHAGTYESFYAERRKIFKAIDEAKSDKNISESEKKHIKEMVDRLTEIGKKLDSLNDNTTQYTELSRKTLHQIKSNGS